MCLYLSEKKSGEPKGVFPKTRGCYPIEVKIPQGSRVKGTILADHIKCIDWQVRNADLFDSLPYEVLQEIENKLGPLIFP